MFFDIEEESQLARGKYFCSSLITAFCDEMERQGFYTGFYMSVSAAGAYASEAVRKRYDYWAAQWAGRCTYSGPYSMWQYTAEGVVPGVSGTVDLDYAYKDYPSVIKAAGLNGFTKEKASGDRTADALIRVLEGWLGYSEENGQHKIIIDLYNSHKPLARGYAVQYTDAWCDTCVSAAGIKAGMTDLIGTECGCEQHVEIFKEKGIWIEDGTITPERGDIVLYNWDDGTQPNDGYSDHIGVVTGVKDGMITVIEGNRNDAVSYRTIPAGWGYIRGYARPRYDAGEAASGEDEKSVEQLALEVINAKWGNGKDRKNRLTAAGYDYEAVQAKVNELLRAENEPKYYSVVKGDTLTAIARKHGISLGELIKLNPQISDPNIIYPGQKIRTR